MTDSILNIYSQPAGGCFRLWPAYALVTGLCVPGRQTGRPGAPGQLSGGKALVTRADPLVTQKPVDRLTTSAANDYEVVTRKDSQHLPGTKRVWAPQAAQ